MNAYREHTKYIIVDENGKPTNEKFKTITILPTTTNGDVIKALFPNKLKLVEVIGDACVYYDLMRFDKNWWNAPYKADSEE